jgi:hypothetical protein
MGALPVMQAAEQGHRSQLSGCGCASRGEPARARGRLVAEAPVGPALVVAEVLTQDALGMALAEDHDVVQAVATKRPHQTLADRVSQRRPGRREKASHPETTEPSPEARVVDAVAVAQQIAWRRVADRLDHALCDPRARRVLGNTHVDDPAALEGDDDERVERLEVHGDLS